MMIIFDGAGNLVIFGKNQHAIYHFFSDGWSENNQVYIRQLSWAAETYSMLLHKGYHNEG